MFARKLSSIDGTIMGALRNVGDLSGPSGDPSNQGASNGDGLDRRPWDTRYAALGGLMPSL